MPERTRFVACYAKEAFKDMLCYGVEDSLSDAALDACEGLLEALQSEAHKDQGEKFLRLIDTGEYSPVAQCEVTGERGYCVRLLAVYRTKENERRTD
jgi:hypothetical protein